MVVWPDRHAGTFGSERLDAAAVSDVRGQLAVGQTGQLRYGPDGARRRRPGSLGGLLRAAPPDDRFRRRRLRRGALEGRISKLKIYPGYAAREAGRTGSHDGRRDHLTCWLEVVGHGRERGP
jgi:hypothetical protein